MNYLQKLCEASNLVYQLMLTYVKSVWSLESPVTFDERFKVTSVPFFMSDFYFIKLKVRQFYIESVILSHFILILY